MHNAYRFYAFTINFGNFSNNDEKKNKYFIMTNDKAMYCKFGLNDSEIDRFRNYDNWFEFTHNGNETIIILLCIIKISNI
jgi:hypothetical protein